MRITDRMLEILHCLQREGEGLGLTDISNKVGLPKSSTHRLLQALESHALIAQDRVTQKYDLGLGLIAMASAVLQRRNLLLGPSQALMERLRNLTGETVCLHVPFGLERVCIRQVESPKAIRYTMELGKPMPLYCGASGKLLLAFMPEKVVDQVIEVTNLAALTTNTVTDPSRLKEQLEAIRSCGYALSFEETTPSVAAASAPVRARDGLVIACVTLYGPLTRLGGDRITECLPDLLATARSMSAVASTSAPRPNRAPGCNYHIDNPNPAAYSGRNGPLVPQSGPSRHFSPPIGSIGGCCLTGCW